MRYKLLCIFHNIFIVIGVIIVLICSGISLTKFDNDGIGPYQLSAIIAGLLMILIGCFNKIVPRIDVLRKKYTDHKLIIIGRVGDIYNIKIKYLLPRILYVNNIQLIIVFIVIIINLFVGESIPLNNGLGWDGVIYGNIVKEFNNVIQTGAIPYAPQGLDSFYYQRLFPSAIVYVILKVSKIAIDYSSIVFTFKLLNSISLFIATYIWGKITNVINMSNVEKWIAYIFLYCNYCILKMYFYYPVLTDQFTFMLSILMLYLYLINRRNWLLLISLVGAFTFPLISLCAVILFVFNNNRIQKTNEIFDNLKTKIISIIFAILICITNVGYMIYTYYIEKMNVISGSVDYIHSVVPLSISTEGIYLFIGSLMLLYYSNVFNIKEYIQYKFTNRLIVAAMIYLLPVLIIKVIAPSQSAQGSQISGLLKNISISFTRPFLFLVSHVIYFGPIIIFLLFYWKAICKALANEGIGIRIIIIGCFIMSIMPESRQLTIYLPFIVLFATRIICEKQLFTKNRIIILCIIALLISKCWLIINTQPLDGSFYDFPFQLYFMQQGPWMSNLMFIVQGCIVLFTTLIIYIIFIKDNNQEKILDNKI
jgi:hypothetical protein